MYVCIYIYIYVYIYIYIYIYRYGGFAEVLGGNKLCVLKWILVAVPLPSTPTCCNEFHSTHPTHKTIPSQNAAWMSEAYSGTMWHKVLGQTHAYNVPCQVKGMRVGGVVSRMNGQSAMQVG